MTYICLRFSNVMAVSEESLRRVSNMRHGAERFQGVELPDTVIRSSLQIL